MDPANVKSSTYTRFTRYWLWYTKSWLNFEVGDHLRIF